MSIAAETWSNQDVYIDDPYEQVMFRWEYKSTKVFRKFYGDSFEDEIHFSNRLFRDAERTGVSITEAQYANGKPRRPHTKP